MRATIEERDTFEAAVLAAASVTKDSPQVPVRGVVGIEAREGLIILKATNSEEAVQIQVRATVREIGEAAVSGERLGAVAKVMGRGEIDITTAEKSLSMKVGEDRFRFPLSEERPAVDLDDTDAEGFTMPGESLAMILRSAATFVGPGKPQPGFEGVRVTPLGDQSIQVMTMNSHRFYRATVPVKQCDPIPLLHVPIDALRPMSVALRGAGDVRVRAKGSSMVVDGGHMKFATLLLQQGHALPLDAILERVTLDAVAFTVPAASLLTAARRVAAVADKSPIVKVTTGAEGVWLRAATKEAEEADVRVSDAKWEGDGEHGIAINVQYLQDYLALVTGLDVRVRLRDEKGALVLDGEGVPTYCIMGVYV